MKMVLTLETSKGLQTIPWEPLPQSHFPNKTLQDMFISMAVIVVVGWYQNLFQT